MEQVNEAQPQSQPPSQRFYALEQLGELAGTITLISEGLQAYRAQVAGLLAGQKKAEAFELYRLLERQRTYLVEQIRATRPFLMELENPLAPAAQKLAEQLAAFPLMTADYSKLTEVLKRFADALPDHQTTDASIIGRLMNNVRLGHYPTDLTHVGYIANSIVFPADVKDLIQVFCYPPSISNGDCRDIYNLCSPATQPRNALFLHFHADIIVVGANDNAVKLIEPFQVFVDPVEV